MSNDRLPIFDYLIAAINPALIMLMVGSLVFFLADVFHQGNYELRLLFVFACFIFANVLITRIAMEQGRSYASMYSFPLMILTALCMWRLVTFTGPLAMLGMPISISLLFLIWFSVDRLTWDCTFVDGTADPSNAGLLHAAGVTSEEEEATPGDQPLGDEAAAQSDPESTKKNKPGTWIVYFSLAALPLFGVGNWFVPGDALDRRQYVFLLLAVYTFSGLALLATTSLMGLRQYLLNRSVSIRPTMMIKWLGAGAIAIVAIMILAWLMPRRSSEYSFLPVAESKDSWEWKWSPGNDGKTETEDGSTGDPNDPENFKQDAGEEGGNDGKEGQGGDSGEESDGGSDGKQPDGNEGKGEDSGESQEDQTEASQDGEQADQSESQANQPEDNQDEGEEGSSSQTSQKPSVSFNPGVLLQSIISILKWLFFAALVIAIVALAFRYREELLASWNRFLQKLKALWEKWFGGPKREQNSAIEEPQQTQPSFGSFRDPFLTGGNQPPDEVIRYTFAALEAWARDHGCARKDDQTPFEFAEQISEQFPAMASHSRLIADLYTQSLYSGLATTIDQAKRLRQPWQAMTAA